jgi:SPP1 family predicted phage head-tail adaptor
MERSAAGTVIAETTHVVHGPYRPDITTLARLVFNGRLLNVVAVANLDELGEELEVLCVEVVK